MMTTKKSKKQEGGRPENWEEICMKRVPPWTPKTKKVEKSKKSEK